MNGSPKRLGCTRIPANRLNPNPDYTSPEEWSESKNLPLKPSSEVRLESPNLEEESVQSPKKRIKIGVKQIFADIDCEPFVSLRDMDNLHVSSHPW